MKRICVLIFMVWVTGLAVPAYSQPRYSLRDLCRLANENAEAIKIAVEDQYIAQQDKARARSVLIPRATLFGSHITHRNPTQSSPDATSVGGKLTQSFTLNGRELTAYDISKQGIEKAEYAKETVRSDYIFQVAQAYIQTLSQKRLVEVAEAEVKRLTAHRNSVQEKLTVGNVTKTALYRAEAELSRAETDYIVAENNVKSSKATIVRLVGIPEAFTVQADDIQDQRGFSITRDEIQTRAMKNRFEIKEAKKTLEIAEKTVVYEKGEYWPSLDLEGGYKKSDLEHDLPSGGSYDYDAEDTYIQAELTFTLFDGGLRRAQIRQAEAKARQAREALSNQEKIVVQESTQAFLDFETAKNTLINLEDELKSAQENFAAVEMQFKYGMADSVDIMDANTLLVEAERRISNAEYAFYLSILKIVYTQGDIQTRLLAEN